ncbi:MAG TPA: aspartate kinase [Lentisphaeria bacterium]|nr:aspartate kinase [Lentisphaeria bacterium]HCG48087.1 aspartate kinase [Lentisphaeria bacterium]
MGNHTIEKIGGTSMSRFGEVMNNVIIGSRKGAELYNRVFVVSAYSGITNLLLEDKKTGEPGVYGHIARDNKNWPEALEKVRERMLEYNRSFEGIGLNVADADRFVNERIDAVRECLKYITFLRSAGHSRPSEYLPSTREFLAALGEAHSAYNSVEILKANGVNARFVDLSGWMSPDIMSLNEAILSAFKDIEFDREMPIVTGYVKYDEGIMKRFDRGYSEITFSKIAVLTDAKEGIIHKEFHLSTGDPKLIGVDKVQIIGNTNFDIADQLSDMDMEAIHSKAAKEMEMKNIPIRIKNAFDPEHPGTLISRDYISPAPRVEMICGRSDLIALEVHDPEMVGGVGYDHRLTEFLARNGINYIAKNTNANTITHYIPQKSKNIEACMAEMRKAFVHATVTGTPVAVVSVIGTNMKIPGFLAKAAKALYEADINVLALDQVMRQVNIQFIVSRDDFKKAQIVLHREFVENV